MLQYWRMHIIRSAGSTPYRRVHEKNRHNRGRDPLVADNVPPVPLVALVLDQIRGERTHDNARCERTQRRHKRVHQCLEVEDARIVIGRLARDQAVDGQDLKRQTTAVNTKRMKY